MANKPRIRFRGFTEDWEQRKLSDITEVIMGQSPSSKNYTDNPNDNILVQGNADLKDGKVIPRLWTKEITKTIDKDGIILTVRAPVGDVAKTDYKVVLGRGVAGIKGNDYIYHFLQKLQNNQYWVSLSSGSTFESINSNDIKDLIIDIPSIEEQTKISILLNNVNSIITLHQHKLKKLNLAKKALLQKLFPRNGSQFPVVRFKGFTDAWEQCKLGDLYKRVNERNDGTLGRDKWISVAKMYFQDPDKVQSNNLDTRTYVMKKGDIAFEGHPNNEFKFGRFVLNDIGTGIISELFPIYRPITEYDLDFWKYAIQLERVMAPIFAKSITSSGNSSNKLDHNHFLNQELLVPNIEEQKKIGTLLSLLSKNITLHQRKLEKLQEVKKGLLQKMFV